MSLGELIKASQRGWLKDVLVGAGLTLVTSGTTLIVFNQLVQRFRSSLGGIPADVLALAGIAGFDVFFSLILGAYVTKFTLSAGDLTLRKI